MILHILKRREWNDASAKGTYTPPSLRSEGFIHCSTASQAVATANIYFAGQPDLVILCIDESRLISPLKYEVPAVEGDVRPDTLFPHIYGPLNLDAIVSVHDFPCDAQGLFELPAAFRSEL